MNKGLFMSKIGNHIITGEENGELRYDNEQSRYVASGQRCPITCGSEGSSGEVTGGIKIHYREYERFSEFSN
tara:strand:- start:253 stop:468 length:216 start_codon:yes stop_codon:yes gene_type:complete